MGLPARSDYMSGRVQHEVYYRSVWREAGIKLEATSPIISDVWDALVNGDEYLNSIKLETWDILAFLWYDDISDSLKKHGDTWSLAGGVCTVKQAATDAAYRAMNAEEREICRAEGGS